MGKKLQDFPSLFYDVLVFASILLGNILCRANYFKYLYTILLVAAFINLYQLTPSARQKELYQTYLKNMDYLWSQHLSSGGFLSLTKTIYGPFIPNSSYYWYGYHNVTIIDTIYHRERYFDLKQELETQKPMFIAYEQPSFTGILMICWSFINENILFGEILPFCEKRRIIPNYYPNSMLLTVIFGKSMGIGLNITMKT